MKIRAILCNIAFLSLIGFQHVEGKGNCNKDNKDSLVIIVTGTSSGIGLATAEHLAKQGHRVYGVMRGTSKTQEFDRIAEKFPSNLFKVTADVTKTDEVSKAVGQVLEKEKRVDVLVNNAASVLVGTVESCTLEEQQKEFDVVFFGPVRMTQAILPSMRQRMKGQIINVSSCCGFAPYPGLEIYSAAKFAVEGLSESMAASLKPFNIKVSLLETGGVKTRGGDNQKTGTNYLVNNPYIEFQKKADEQIKQSLANGDDPADVARTIEKIITAHEPHLRYQFGTLSVSLAERRFKDPTGDSEVHSSFSGLMESKLVPYVGEMDR